MKPININKILFFDVIKRASRIRFLPVMQGCNPALVKLPPQILTQIKNETNKTHNRQQNNR